MATPNRYLRFFSRVFLLAGYVFLFATQFNHRYYSLANFVEYGRAPKMTSTGRTIAGHNFTALPNRAHLGLDKRFSVKHAVKHNFTDFTAAAPYTAVARLYCVPLKVYSSSLVTANTLRGPPCA
jgi:hypothetical protein